MMPPRTLRQVITDSLREADEATGLKHTASTGAYGAGAATAVRALLKMRPTLRKAVNRLKGKRGRVTGRELMKSVKRVGVSAALGGTGIGIDTISGRKRGD